MELGECVSGLCIMLSLMCSFAVLSNTYVFREADFLIFKKGLCSRFMKDFSEKAVLNHLLVMQPYDRLRDISKAVSLIYFVFIG